MTSVTTLIFLAVLVQVLLTLVQYVRLVRVRGAAVAAGDADLARAGFDPAAWPQQARLIANSVHSQFELPVLFYAGLLFSFVLGGANWLVVALAWLFVLSRIVHAMIHTGANAIMPRLRAFLFGVAVIVILWAYLAVHVVGGWLALA